MFEQKVEFVNLDIFSAADRQLLTENNPAQKIPALLDGDMCIYDSGTIYRYLAIKFQHQPLSWQQENLLTLIDAANDSLVSMLILQRSNIDIEQDALFFNLQRERCQQVFEALNKAVAEQQFNQWHYVAIALFCLLDWVKYRSLFDWQGFEQLHDFYQRSQSQAGVEQTDPRMT